MKFESLIISIIIVLTLSSTTISSQISNEQKLSSSSNNARNLQNEASILNAITNTPNINSQPIDNKQLQFGTLQNNVPSSTPINPLQNTQNSIPINQGQIANPQQTQQPVVFNEIDTPILGRGYKVNAGVSYQRIKINKLSGKFLFFYFSLAEKDKWQKVKITLSIDGVDKILKECEYDGADSCYLPSSAVKQDAIIFAHIQCQQDCTYNLNTHWSDLQHLNPGDEIVFMFGKDKTQIYHVQLPKDKQFEQLRIHLAPRVTRKPLDNLKVYGKYGSDATPTPQDYDFKSVSLWEDGEGIFLSKKKLKENAFSILVIGQSQTTYSLNCELITGKSHEIHNGQHLYQHLDSNSQKKYKVNFDTKKFDEFSLKVSTLMGSVKIAYFIDVDGKKPFTMQPFEYMKDSEYIFYSNQIVQLIKDGLFIKVTSQDKDATFTLKFVGRKQTESVELNQHVYGFIPLQDVKFAHFNFKRWKAETELKSSLKFTVNTINVVGKVTPEFFVCNTNLDQCTDPQNYKKFTSSIEAKPHNDISQKNIYSLQVNESVLHKVNIVEEQAIIIIRMTGKASAETNNYSLVAIELVNNNKILYLREGRPLQQKLGQSQMKLYKYINSDPKVLEIRVHLNQIAGHVKMSGTIKSDDNTNAISVMPQANTLRFIRNLTQPIIIAVTAQQKAIFGISLQVIYKNQVQKGANIISISEDLVYTANIQPNSYAIFEVTPIFYDFSFSYESSQSVIACVTNSQGRCINLEGIYLDNPKLAVKGEITQAKLKDRKARIKITNPFGDSITEVNVIFHSRKFNSCETQKIGKMYNSIAKSGKCVKYLLEDRSQILDIFISKREFASLTYSVLLCGNSIQGANTMRNIELTPETITKMCSKSNQAKQISIVWSVSTKNVISDDKQVNINIVAQYRGGLVVLPQGVSHNVVAKAKQGALKIYAFNLINKIGIKVMLNQIRGNFKAFAKFVNQPEKQVSQISQINYHFASSSTVDFSQQPIILISDAQVQQAKCVTCSLLIAVYSMDDIGKQVEFQIQIVQHYSGLTQDSAVSGYLQAGSFAYYFYNARQSYNTTLLFLLSDHNQQCANMYLGLSENPGPNYHVGKAIGGNQLIFRHTAGQKKYFLSVEATKLCDYTVSIITIQSSIHRLERGKQHLIKLAKGKVKYFSFEHPSAEPFKIVTLAKYGEVKLYINQSFLQVNRKAFTNKQLQLSKFSYKSQQSNTLAIGQNHQVFCQNCNYFLAVEGIQNTEATLYLTYPQTIIPLLAGKILSDFILKKSDFTLASYNRIQKTKLQIKVHHGEIDISIIYKQFSTSKAFSAKQQYQTIQIDPLSHVKVQKIIPEANPNLGKQNTTSKTQIIERIPVNIIISAKTDSVSYTLEMISLEESEDAGGLAVYQSIVAGQPNHILVSNTKVLCLTGYFRQNNQKLIISTNSDNQVKLNNIKMEGKLNSQKAKIERAYYKNILTLTLTHPNITKGSSSFQICLKLVFADSQNKDKQIGGDESDEAEEEQIKLNAVVSLSNSVNVLQSDIQAVVQGQNTFVVHSNGEFLLDVFQCKGEAKVNYANSLKNIENGKPKLLQMLSTSGQRHAIKIIQNDTTFVQVKAERAIVSWIPISFETDKGTGYLKFETGDLKYQSSFKYIKIQFQPLQQIKITKSKIKEITYTLYFSNVTDAIEEAIQCDTSSSLVTIAPIGSKVAQKNAEKQYFSYDMDKQSLQKNYPDSPNIYFSVVAKLSLEPFSQVDKNSRFATTFADDHEHYRFIYSRQQIPSQLYKRNKIQAISYTNLAVIVGSVTFLLILCTCLFTRKIVPLIARLKNSNLVQQAPADVQHKDDLEVPASSDRNQRAQQMVIQTDQRLDK